MRRLINYAAGVGTAGFLAIFANAGIAQPTSAPTVDKSAGNLMVVLRPVPGQNRPDETLSSAGAVKARLSDGREVELEPAWLQYIGDMQLRFVFDGPSSMRNAMAEDLKALNLTPATAVAQALDNIKRVYGNPQSKPFTGALMQVAGKSPDLDSSYFLDKTFWNSLLKQHPDGLVAGVPKRGGLIYVPASDITSVNALKQQIGKLYSSSEQMRVSSALYLFKDGKWTVFQAPSSK